MWRMAESLEDEIEGFGLGVTLFACDAPWSANHQRHCVFGCVFGVYLLASQKHGVFRVFVTPTLCISHLGREDAENV